MCDLLLRKNNCPYWTTKHIENYIEYPKAYGLSFSDEDISWHSEKIKNMNPDKRIGEGQVCFEIFDAETYVGDIIIDISEEIPELDVLIFSEYCGRGYAKRSIKRYLDNEGKNYKNIEITIRHENPDISKVKKIIGDLGFEYLYSADKVEVYQFNREYISNGRN